MYKLMKVIDGQPYEWGNYDTADEAAKAAFDLGRNASVVEGVKVVEDNTTNVIKQSIMDGYTYG